MKYNREKLIEQFEQGEKLKYIFFWGHQSKNPEIITSTCFSQWYEAPFIVDTIEYRTTEHWMMAKKAKLFHDEEKYFSIIKARTPGEAKSLGRQIQNFDEEIWNKHKYEIVVEGNTYKFEQHQKLKTFLMETHQRILVEASPVDTIWGVGLAKDDKNIHNPKLWKGENLLGFALMEVRDKFRILEK